MKHERMVKFVVAYSSIIGFLGALLIAYSIILANSLLNVQTLAVAGMAMAAIPVTWCVVFTLQFEAFKKGGYLA